MITNAVITSANVQMGGYQDQMLSLYVCVKFEDGCSGMVEGHYSLYLPPSWGHHKELCPLGHIIYLWLQAAGVTNVQDMVGKAIRIDLESLSLGASCVPNRVGHIVDNTKWFSTAEICDRWKAGELK